MNLDTLRLFCDVVQYQSFSRGAAMHGVSQSAATQAIHRMEKDLNVILFDRSVRPPQVTPEGELCARGFRELLQQYDDVITKVQMLGDSMSGQIRVGAIYSVGLHVMSRCMSDFLKTYPKAKVRLEFLHPQKVYQAVHDAEVDLGILSYPTASREIEVIPLSNETMVLACPPQHPLAKRKTVTLKELDTVDFIGFDADLPIRKEIDQHLKKLGVAVNLVMEFDNIETIKQAVESGLGVSVLPAPTVRNEIEGGLIKAVPINSPKITRPIGIIHKSRKLFSPIAKKFIEMLVNLQE